jgi:exodeoxyribonuclease VII small subunit
VTADHSQATSGRDAAAGGEEAEGRATGYADAVAELETILAELEDDTVDVDVLGARVARAAELIELCRGRIEKARMEVTRIVAAMEAGDDGPPGGAG